ncbi:Dabb family protein [Brucella cytisi]|uniref:Dabb family protein n=1 Tax=Brucella cytisi TaxID=407152 RepID=UPI00313BCF34
MIRHIVLVEFRSELGAAQIDEKLQAVVALKDKIGGILSITAGENNSLENLEKGFPARFCRRFHG